MPLPTLPGPWPRDALVRYDCDIVHTRKMPVAHRFRYRSPMWLVDVDRVPGLPKAVRFLGRFEAADHWTSNATSLRNGVDGFLRARGRPPPARVLLLTGARSFGHCFNPLSVYWCFDAGGRQTDVIAEVHNTYRGRHAYLLKLDDAGRDQVAKVFYVSPFLAAEGRYRMRISPPEERLDVVIALETGAGVPFTASLHGVGGPASRWSLLTTPAAQLRVAVLIRLQGIRLWRRQVPVQPRTGSSSIETAVAGNLRQPPDPVSTTESRSA